MRTGIKGLWEKNDAESFKAKFTLLIIDKVIIGLMATVGFLIYDFYKTQAQQEFENAQVQIQLDMERTKLAKELWPMFLNDSLSVISRAFVLRSAVITRAVEPEVAIDLLFMLYRKNLNHEDFKRVCI